VVDGDTFHLCNGFKVRLGSIDTPENKEPFYFEARRALAAMLQTRNIQIKDCRIDSTGKRHACKVHADGKDVQAELVWMGLAWDWPKYSGGRYAQQKKEAKISKRGLWVNNQASVLHWGKCSPN
jgi:micrococcal nuclease